ncbi:vanadium-dependent haloperoxidase [Neolewinella sp.]|uniref:vanadium-dependent haloperoxidase n=1 Tax=Neolewinella sp. TaxID=2993543 RepID=UPI003B52D7F5
MMRYNLSLHLPPIAIGAARLTLLLTLLVLGCERAPTYTDSEIALAWARLSLDITKDTPGNSPTYASRCFGYLGVTMYESVVHGSPDHRSLVGQLSGLDHLPVPNPDAPYDWALVLNAAQAAMLRDLYQQTSPGNIARIDSLERRIVQSRSREVDQPTIKLSVAYGGRLASMIYEWSKSDGGHRAYLRNFDKALVHPQRPGGWQPPLYAQSFSHHPLHPAWGTNRPFVPANYGMAAPAFIAFDTVPGSPYYAQFRSVYDKGRTLTQAEKEAALWWGDDPAETFTPPGHSYYLATMILEQEGASLISCAETLARTGIAVADAFINCWRWKFEVFSERPNTFIAAHIDAEWESFWPDPPFPAFPSGHAVQAAAAAEVLMDLHGDDHVLMDASHEGRQRDVVRDVEFRTRNYTRLSELAREVADSRFYGGIHTPQDNERGLERGADIGRHVNGLQWRN